MTHLGLTLTEKMTVLTVGSNGDAILPVRWQRTTDQVPDHWDLFDLQTLKQRKRLTLDLLDIVTTRLSINLGPSLWASIFC
jgi:hypothetical protein